MESPWKRIVIPEGIPNSSLRMADLASTGMLDKAEVESTSFFTKSRRFVPDVLFIT
jgi:hypothetical protein